MLEERLDIFRGSNVYGAQDSQHSALFVLLTYKKIIHLGNTYYITQF